MASPDQYRGQVSELGLDHMKIEASSAAEANEALKRIRGIQKELQQIKRSLNLEIKTVRAAYSQRMSTAASTSSGVVSLFGKRKLAGQLRADEKRRLSRERDRALEPYEAVKFTIDDLLVQLDSTNVQLQTFIDEVKAEERTQRQETIVRKSTETRLSYANFCPQCGNAVDKSNKFCSQCGGVLG